MPSSLLEIRVHIPACARRREKDFFARLCQLCRFAYALLHILAVIYIIEACLASRFLYDRSISAQQHQSLHMALQVLGKLREVLSFSVSARYQNDAALKRFESDYRSV
jgi:hypothetical protein